AGAASNTIGGTVAGARNVISGNYEDGVDISASSNLVEGNYIGTDQNGTAKLGNDTFSDVGGGGVVLWGGAASNTIGGTTNTPGTAAGNVISGNYIGVNLSDSGTAGNLIQGNLVGTDKNGTT